MMTLSFRLLLDMHKCQSDYNAGSAARRALLLPARPQCVYRFVIWLSAFSTPKKRTAPRHELRAVSVTTPIHSLTRCLHAHRARQDAIGPRSDCWSRPRRRSCHWHIVHRRLCLYAGALIAARLHFVWGRAENLDSRSKPSGVVTPAPACDSFGTPWAVFASARPQMKSNVLIILPSKSFLSAFHAKQFPVTFAWQVPPSNRGERERDPSLSSGQL